MSWFYTAATIMVAMAVLVRLLWWAYEKTHRLAAQRHGAAGGLQVTGKTSTGAKRGGQVPCAVEVRSHRPDR